MNLQRMLVDRMEHRIILGTVAFLAIMVLVGWIAINENGRMMAFQRQYEARAIERGAELFTSNCAECHGENGLGGIRAPALNSPLLFGHDYLPEYHRALTRAEAEQNTLNAELENVETPPSAERVTAINARLAEIDTELAAADTEAQAIRQQLQSAIDKGYNPDNFSRLTNLGWGGSLQNFIYTTLVHGRPTSISYWPQPMPAWSQTAGGPLRTDQLQDITSFILNWDKGSEWSVEDLLAVNQFPKTPVEGTGELPPAVEGAIGVETPIEDVMVGLADVTGDPQTGLTLYNELGCASCHVAGVVAPITAGTWTRVQEVRLLDAALAGYTAEQYLAESITHPSDYLAPGFSDLMPKDFANRLNYQQLADLIAYLATQDQPLP